MNRFLPVEDTKPHSLRNFLYSLFTVFIMLIALPTGVYLVGQNTNFIPLAATPSPTIIPMNGDTSYAFDLKPDSNQGSVVGVNVLVRSDNHYANVFATRITFPSDLLSVDSIVTDPAGSNSDKSQIKAEWIKSSYDNTSGSIDLVAGVAFPGLITIKGQKYVLATIYFSSKTNAQAQISFDPNSRIYSAEDNTVLPTKKTDVLLKIPGPPAAVVQPNPSCVPYPACFDNTTPCKIPTPSGGWCNYPATSVIRNDQPTLELLSPKGGETLNFNTPDQILWQSSHLDTVQIEVMMNNKVLGRIASVSASLQKLEWLPKNYIYPTFANSTNSFKILLIGNGPKDASISAESKGPFDIMPNTSVLASSSQNSIDRDLNGDGKTDLTDLSILFSSFGRKPLNRKADLNGDNVVNDIDVWLFTQGLRLDNLF